MTCSTRSSPPGRTACRKHQPDIRHASVRNTFSSGAMPLGFSSLNQATEKHAKGGRETQSDHGCIGGTPAMKETG